MDAVAIPCAVCFPDRTRLPGFTGSMNASQNST